MKLASIETIKAILPHTNADALEIVQVLNYKCVVRKADAYQVGEEVLFIQPDTVLPDQPWATIFKAKSNRVKAIKLRGEWSEGIVLRPNVVDLPMGAKGEVASLIGVTKYEAPMPQDLQAKGGLPFGLPITDEERWNNIDPIPYGEVVTVTLKRDGKSWTGYAIEENGQWYVGITGRRLEYKLDAQNDYTRFQSVLTPLLNLAQANNVSLAIRGEITGAGIQAFAKNPHAKGEKQLRLFSTYLVKERRYAGTTDPFHYLNIAQTLGVEPVETVEHNVILTPELIKKYAEDLTEIDGQPFEGVVIKGKNFSFKVISKAYDAQK